MKMSLLTESIHDYFFRLVKKRFLFLQMVKTHTMMLLFENFSIQTSSYSLLLKVQKAAGITPRYAFQSYYYILTHRLGIEVNLISNHFRIIVIESMISLFYFLKDKT